MTTHTTSPKLLAFAGSARQGSTNRQLVAAAAAFAREAGAEVTLLDLRDFPMPIYDGDLEASSGLPEHVQRLKALMRSHQGFLISSPEFNSSITPLLKNAIDWCSRPAPGEGPLACYAGKVAGLMAASPGALGGLRGLVTVRSILSNIGVLVVPQQFALSKAHEAFDANGALKDERHAAQVRDVASAVARLARLTMS